MKKATPEKSDTYVTMGVFENAMQAMAESLSTITHTTDLTLREIMNIRDTIKDITKNNSESEIQLLSHDRKIENLLVRVEKLESKVK